MKIETLHEHLKAFIRHRVQNIVFIHGFLESLETIKKALPVSCRIIQNQENISLSEILYLLEYKQDLEPLICFFEDLDDLTIHNLEIFFSQLESSKKNSHPVLFLVLNPPIQTQYRFKNALHLAYTTPLSDTPKAPLSLRERLLKIFLSAQPEKISKNEVVSWVLNDLTSIDPHLLEEKHLRIIDELIKITDISIDASPCEKFMKWSLFRYMQQLKESEKRTISPLN